MPKAEKPCTKRGAVLARERREREKKDVMYNDCLKDFIQLKYRHIIAEFEPVYKTIMARRPSNLIYTGTKEFRLWRRREMHKELQPEQPVVQTIVQPVEQTVVQTVEQTVEQAVVQPVEQTVVQTVEQTVEQAVVQPVEQTIVQTVEQAVVQPVEQTVEQAVVQPVEPTVEQAEQLAELLPDLGQLVNEVVMDEGISLDVWEELQADVRDLDYRLEVELGQYLP